MSYVVGAEIFSVLMLIIILYAALFEVRKKTRRTQYFVVCVILILLANLLDLGTYWFDIHPNMPVILPVAVLYLDYIIGFFSEAAYCFYIESCLEQKGENLSGRFSKAALLLAIIMSIVFGIMCSMGGIFVVQNGQMIPSWGNLFTQSIVLLGMAIITFYVFLHRKSLSSHDLFALNSYAIFPLVGVVSTIIVGSDSPIYPCCTVSIVLVYVIFQRDQERDMEQINSNLMLESQRDSLTNLLNRRAYDYRCEHIEEASPVGILFLDLNALKYTNDHYGHKAGDDLLISLADLLRKNFRGDIIYRISGDEFVVIIEGIAEESMMTRAEELHRYIEKMELPIASMGYSHGLGKQIGTLIQQAEKKMYIDKNKFYEQYSQYIRESNKNAEGTGMTLAECYKMLHGDYEEARKRLMNENIIQRFIFKFLSDPTMDQLRKAVKANEHDEAFRSAHTLKGIAANLAFTELQIAASDLTEQLRNSEGPASPELMEKVEEQYHTACYAINAYQTDM